MGTIAAWQDLAVLNLAFFIFVSNLSRNGVATVDTIYCERRGDFYKQSSKQGGLEGFEGSKQGGKKASKQGNKQARSEGRKQASKERRKEASKEGRKHASNERRK